MKNTTKFGLSLGLAVAALAPLSAYSQEQVEDKLNGNASTYEWEVQGGACLTHDGVLSTSTIPGCKTLPYYNQGVRNNNGGYGGKAQVQAGGQLGTLPDFDEKGALRLTNGGNDGIYNIGSVISKKGFATNKGVQITFSTATYAGNGLATTVVEPGATSENAGADGMVFFLTDSAKLASTGGAGGSLGYSCSNSNGDYDGVKGGYLAVGIDEFGNFSNKSDNTSTPSTQKDANGKVVFTEGSHPGSIVVRGAGDVNYDGLTSTAALQLLYPPTADQDTRKKYVQETCKAGRYINFSNRSQPDPTAPGQSIKKGDQSANTILNYDYIKGVTLPASTKLYSGEGNVSAKRADANVFTYSLSISQARVLNLSYSVNGGAPSSVVKDLLIDNGPLPAAFRFGFSAGTGMGTNVHEITCFKASPMNVSSTGAGSNQQSGQVQTTTQIYLSYFHPLNSWGQLVASPLVVDPLTGAASVSTTAKWDAHCVLTGGVCSSTGATGNAAAQGSLDRVILTWNRASAAGVGVPFLYPSLDPSQQAALGGLVDGAARVEFLRGSRGYDFGKAVGGKFRVRDGILADMKNSSPTLVSVPSRPYSRFTADDLTGTSIPEYASYQAFVKANATRTHVVYTGANDGMLHGFRAGAFSSPAVFDGTKNDGKEVLAYVPDAVIKSIYNPNNSKLDFTSTEYAHNAYVDATPESGDIFYNNKWTTILVGGLGAGGNLAGEINDNTSVSKGAVYALDVTNPDAFGQLKAAELVLGEWNDTSKCDDGSACGVNMGGVYGSPVIRRMHDGTYAAIFGNGRNSSSGVSGIFVLSFSTSNKDVKLRFIKAGDPLLSSNGALVAKNGIDNVTVADLENDGVADYVYAGDSQGQLWRFDVTSATPSSWGVTKLYTTAGNAPISTKVTLTGVKGTAGSRIIVNFATGRMMPQTYKSQAVYATGSQAVYGLWDYRMTNWNNKSTTKFLDSATPPGGGTLQTQTVTDTAFAKDDISGVRTSSQNTVCWFGTTACGATGNNHIGWKVVLPVANEQVIYNPVVAYGALFLNTTIPVVDTLSCEAQKASGFTMAISIASGGAPDQSLFDTASKNAGINAGGKIVTGLGLSGVGAPSFVETPRNGGAGGPGSGKPHLVEQTSDGTAVVKDINPVMPGVGRRVTWKKLR